MFNNINSKNIVNLKLKNIIVIKGFYINIILIVLFIILTLLVKLYILYITILKFI